MTTAGTRAAVAAPNTHATAAAEAVLAAGGSAVDAAIAAMVTTTTTEPGIISTLAGCYVNIWPADGEPVVVDGNVEMPGRARAGDLPLGPGDAAAGRGIWEIHATYGGGMVTHVGPASVATPGMFAAMGWAHEHFGQVPWPELLQPAADVARSGFRLGRTAQSYLVLITDTILAWDPATRALLTWDGAPPEVGMPIRSPELADTLEHLGRAGADDLYRGDVARAIAADMADRDGLISAEDLAAYRPLIRPALRSRLGRWDLACNPPPSIGGPVLTALLRLLSATPGRITAAEAATIMRDVLDIRLDRMDTAPDLEAAGTELLATLRDIGSTGLPTSPSTAHVSVVDGAGNACALTASAGYGSGMTVRGTGLVANNSLGELELNRRGLHALAPGTRLASNMAPTTAHGETGEVLAVGTPGADRITTALAQVLVHLARHGSDLQTAIDEPRMHPRRLEDGTTRIDHEADDTIAASLDEAGLPRHEHRPSSMFFGGVGAAMRSGDGTLTAGADARREAAVLVR